jgi:hypothetical protein
MVKFRCIDGNFSYSFKLGYFVNGTLNFFYKLYAAVNGNVDGVENIDAEGT